VIAGLALKSLRNRRFTAALTVASIALAVALLLAVERVRQQTREGFAATVSGTDLVVGARASPVHLLLASVFRIGNPANNVDWHSYEEIAAHPQVAWTIPLSLGDSHRGFRVVGTTGAYFEHYRYARDRSLALAAGRRFEQPHDAVLGAEAARALGYGVGQALVIAHGTGDEAFSEHGAQPFRVVGVLARTGTPVDRAIHVPLEGIDALHDQGKGAHDPLAAARHHDDERQPISAFLVGLKSRGAALAMQRVVNEYAEEPLTAILPGVTLLEVWEIAGAAERTLLAVSVLVVVVGLAAMLIALLASVSGRRREMAVLRSVGARPLHVFALILGEAALLTLLGIALGVAALYGGLLAGQPWLESRLGVFMGLHWPSAYELGVMMLLAAAGTLVGVIPAWRVYRLSLADGMTMRM
jgi:putative ABC transport system permease protein